MSNDIAADWLLHGVAAAHAGEKEEARDLLEHALVELDVMAEVYGTNDTDARELAMADNLLVAASHSLPATVLNALVAPASGAGEQDVSNVVRPGRQDGWGVRPSAGESSGPTFDLSALAPYAEKYLAHWPAEIYQISLADASLVARERAFADAKRRSSPGPEVQQLSYESLVISIDTYKLILLPSWVSELHFKGQGLPARRQRPERRRLWQAAPKRPARAARWAARIKKKQPALCKDRDTSNSRA